MTDRTKRRLLLGGIFGIAASSLLNKFSNNRNYVQDLTSEIYGKRPEEIAYSTFFEDLKKDRIQSIIANDEKLLLTYKDGTEYKTTLSSSDHILSLAENEAQNFENISLSFDKTRLLRHPLNPLSKKDLGLYHLVVSV